jgi:hypothetical protein
MADIFDNKANIQMLLQGTQMYSNAVQQRAELELRKQQFEENKRQFLETQKLQQQKMDLESEIEGLKLDQAKQVQAQKEAEYATTQDYLERKFGADQMQDAKKNALEEAKLTGKIQTPVQVTADIKARSDQVSGEATNVDSLEITLPGQARPIVINPGRYKGLNVSQVNDMVMKEGGVDFKEAIMTANPELRKLLGDSANSKLILDGFKNLQLKAINEDPEIQRLRKLSATGPAPLETPPAAGVSPLSRALGATALANKGIDNTQFQARAAAIQKLKPQQVDVDLDALVKDFRAATRGLTPAQLLSASAPIVSQLGTPELRRKFVIAYKQSK